MYSHESADRDGRIETRPTSRRSLLATLGAGTTTLFGAGSPAGASEDEDAQERPSDSYDHRVVSYYTGWSRYDREFYPEDVPLDRITDCNYAFLTVEEDGAVDYADEWGDQENLAAFRDLQADSPDTNFYLSIGGWSDSQYFSNAAATAENRERFAETAIELLREYEFDGVDLDWEYPGGGGHEQNVTREDDPENFVLLLETLREHLDAAEAEDDASYGITMAAAANPETAGNLLLEEIEPYLEYVTVMTYDFVGGWSDVTGHNAPLYGDGLDVADAMAWWADQPIPREKVLLGLPFYGRVFTGVEGTTNGLGEPFESEDLVLFGEIDDEYATDDGFEGYWDEEAAVPYRFAADESTFVTYDDAESIARKAAFTVEEGFGGVMAWEQAGDPDGVLLDAVHDSLSDSAADQPACAAADAADWTTLENGDVVCDLDGDGNYRDVTASGDVTTQDLQQFFERQHRTPYDERADLFDFTANGAVGQPDVVDLFHQL